LNKSFKEPINGSSGCSKARNWIDEILLITIKEVLSKPDKKIKITKIKILFFEKLKISHLNI